MESIGQKLKSVREEKGLSLDQVARDTHIAKRFVSSLENDDFTSFPGDTYVIGFLRNYAEYLGLDVPELISLYKNMKIQEQPVPLDALIVRRRRFRVPLYVWAGLALLGVAAGVLLFFSLRPPSDPSTETKAAAPVRYEYKGEVLEQAFAQGDVVVIEGAGENGSIRVDKISGTVVLIGPNGKLTLKPGQESLMEIGGGQPAVKVFCRAINKNEKPPRVVLRFDSLIQTPAGLADSQAPGGSAVNAAGSSPAVGSTNEPTRVRRSQVILESPGKNPFILEVEFRGYCLFRYAADDAEREERYFRRGETFRIDVRNEIRLWYSNSGSLRARIQGKEIEFGKPGEVSTSMIKWVKNESGTNHRLELIPVY
jgi:cytoskeletal protein RodZ